MKLHEKLLSWILAIFLIVICFFAGNWQLNKGLKLSQKNRDIATRSTQAPINNPKDFDEKLDQWRLFSLYGSFKPEYRLLKNQYQEGQFGFHIIQNFDSKSLGIIAIDRGWVKAGPNASTPPKVPQVNPGSERVLVRLRSEFLNTHLGGTLFAIPTSKKGGQEIYFDLIEGERNQPITNIELPNLSTGPHFAYAFQWYLFAIVFIVGRIVIGKRLNVKSN